MSHLVRHYGEKHAHFITTTAYHRTPSSFRYYYLEDSSGLTMDRLG